MTKDLFIKIVFTLGIGLLSNYLFRKIDNNLDLIEKV